MSGAVVPLRHSPAFAQAMHTFGRNPVLGVILGLVMTVVIQSSSATVGILMAVAAASPDVITLNVAIPMLFGNNIGTCVTAILASVGANRTAKRTAVVHLLFNVLGAAIFIILLGPFARAIAAMSPGAHIQRQIANAHTLFNVATTLVLFPSAGLLERLATRLVPGADIIEEAAPRYLDWHVLGTPGVALDLAVKELARLAEIAQKMLSYARRSFLEPFSRELDRELASMEEIVDRVSRQVALYLSQMVSSGRLTQAQSQRLAGLMHVAGDGAHRRLRGAADEVCVRAV